MNIYIDHNFLISCTEANGWKEDVLLALDQSAIRIVLSPWNIREIGNNTMARMDPLIAIAESFRPIWILERLDLQLAETGHAWRQFWQRRTIQFSPFGTLSEIHGIMFNRDPKDLKKLTLRDYASAYQPPPESSHISDKDIFEKVVSRQEQISLINRDRFKRGQLRSIKSVYMKRVYLARILAYNKLKLLAPQDTDKETDRILNDPVLFQKISMFAESGRMQEMRAYCVEVLLTEKHWAGNARLNSHTQIDRQHAIAGLAYCDVFVTNDKKLTANANAIKTELNFPIASVVTGEVFINHLQRRSWEKLLNTSS